VRDENPLIRGFYLPLPSDSRSTDGQSLSATLSLTNTLNVESRPHESVFVDARGRPAPDYENTLWQSWRYRFTVPIIHYSGGFLTPLDRWHGGSASIRVTGLSIPRMKSCTPIPGRPCRYHTVPTVSATMSGDIRLVRHR